MTITTIDAEGTATMGTTASTAETTAAEDDLAKLTDNQRRRDESALAQAVASTTTGTTAQRKLTYEEKKENKKQWAVKLCLQKLEDFEKAKVFNRERIKAQPSSQQTTMPPDRKDAVTIQGDDMWPGFTMEEYVSVKGGTSPGKNRSDGYDWVKKIYGVGTATIYDFKCDVGYDGGYLHKNIPCKYISPASCYQDVWRMSYDEHNKRKSTRSKEEAKPFSPPIDKPKKS